MSQKIIIIIIKLVHKEKKLTKFMNADSKKKTEFMKANIPGNMHV